MTNPSNWREHLSPEQYHVCREKGTEPAFTGLYTDCEQAGLYRCVCCNQALFSSESKYHSGSGWPSFWDVLNSDCVQQHDDFSHGMHRIEVTCSQCGSHLGHVFPDGPQPTGLRYCINSIALQLESQP